METILEQQRRLHEERERLVDAMRKESLHNKTTLRENINSDHRIKILLDKGIDVCNTLTELYEDNDGLRQEEVEAIAGPNEFQEFYKRLKEVKDFHRKHPNEIFIPMTVEFDELDKARESPTDEMNNMVEFTDEEAYGRFLDLHECYMLYINLKGCEKISYVKYLDTFDKLFDMPKDRKNKAYEKYLQVLLDYLVSFCSRIKPLLDLSAELDKVKTTFTEQWESSEFPGWGKEAGSAMAHTGAHLDLSAFSSAEELASLGLDRLKSALMALNLKCGGTLDQRAERLYITKGKRMEDLKPSLFSKAKSSKREDPNKGKGVAFLEAQVYHLMDLLGEQRQATRDNVQRRQARTGTERADDGEEVASESESEEDEDEIIYNPKNLPLGWDGKPIPYWLYKLHGLNINFKCEICGNQTYRGPKAFQRHFSEWRHAHGMRCLGIPNTAHFANVTQIEDAMALWTKIKQAKDAERWNPEHEEEFEDSAGNVVTKKTYDDLQRQGLL
ncbi:splicing factor 3A subunit 3-like [Clavelina lepadiformis]|uniref:splicing factor 3A subunit 3-like n=1 Tax=Clavelina lepadiformis TaxID=159417 RepID=UPI0040417B03